MNQNIDFMMPLRNAYYQLNTHPIIPVNQTGEPDDTFGVLTLDLNEVSITTRPVFILSLIHISEPTRPY